REAPPSDAGCLRDLRYSSAAGAPRATPWSRLRDPDGAQLRQQYAADVHREPARVRADADLFLRATPDTGHARLLLWRSRYWRHRQDLRGASTARSSEDSFPDGAGDRAVSSVEGSRAESPSRVSGGRSGPTREGADRGARSRGKREWPRYTV